MKRFIVLMIFLSLISGLCFFFSGSSSSFVVTKENTTVLPENSPVSFKKGDILVRPNWGFLPGSCSIQQGRRSGHVAIVTGDASGNTVEEALAATTVIEALFYDQGSRKFQFQKKDQIREGKALVSFGRRFQGMRYRLRLNLNEEQSNALLQFLKNQLDGGYNILSLKRQLASDVEKEMTLRDLKNENWNCATLTWEAFYLVAGVDLDANQGKFIFPNDIIASRYFDSPDGRILF